jgi:hypothetical protein
MEHSAPPSSPLDDVLVAFLAFVRDQANGYVGGARQTQEAAEALEVPEPLIDAMFTSARTRTLLEPDFNARGRTRWVLSRRGVAFLDRLSAS